MNVYCVDCIHEMQTDQTIYKSKRINSNHHGEEIQKLNELIKYSFDMLGSILMKLRP